jgi:hypothetical protein
MTPTAVTTYADLDPSEPTDDGVSGDDSAESSTDAVVVGLVGALAGSLLTLAGEGSWAWWRERRSFAVLRSDLAGEIRQAMDEARNRASRPASRAFPFDDPLPTSAWDAAIRSESSWRLRRSPSEYRQIKALYDQINAANHSLTAAREVFLLSQSPSMDDRESEVLRSWAAGLLRTPWEPVVAVEDQVTSAMRVVCKVKQ